MSRIVELHDHGPYLVKKAELERDVVAICRCGLSAKWPLCDGSHSTTLSEVEGTLVGYRRDGQGKLEREPIDTVPAGKFDPRA